MEQLSGWWWNQNQGVMESFTVNPINLCWGWLMIGFTRIIKECDHTALLACFGAVEDHCIESFWMMTHGDFTWFCTGIFMELSWKCHGIFQRIFCDFQWFGPFSLVIYADVGAFFASQLAALRLDCGGGSTQAPVFIWEPRNLGREPRATHKKLGCFQNVGFSKGNIWG